MMDRLELTGFPVRPMLGAYVREGFMAPVITRIFRNGRNQAVRIPAELMLDAETVTIERQGDALILRPLPSGGWGKFFADPSLVLPPEFEIGD